MKRLIQNALMKLSNLYKALNYKYNGTKAESNIGMKSIKEELVEMKVVEVAAPVINSETSVKFLYAQPVANGYQVVDTT
jgi:short-subunit dehydrogenase involved in D-alanine esterification of teichoic acids